VSSYEDAGTTDWMITTVHVAYSTGEGKFFKLHILTRYISYFNIVTDLINALPGKSANTVQHATIEEAVFSVDPTDAPIDWLDSDHVIYVYCRSVSLQWLYK
jgi:hypothetical protein